MDLKEMIGVLRMVAVIGVKPVPVALSSGLGKVVLARFSFDSESVRTIFVPPTACTCSGGPECGVVGSSPVTFFAPSRAQDVEIELKLMLLNDTAFLSVSMSA